MRENKPRSGACRSCSAVIIFARTRRGTTMPLDAKPVADGEFVLRDNNGAHGTPVDAVLFSDAGKVGEPRYRTHFATCPQAAQHRTRRSG